MSIENLGFTSPTLSQSGGKTEVKTTIRLEGRAVLVAVDFDEIVGKELAIKTLSKLAALVKESGIGSANTVTFRISKEGKIVNEQSIIKVLNSEIESKMDNLYQAAINLESDFTKISATIKPEIKRLEAWKDSVHQIVDKFNKTIKKTKLTHTQRSSTVTDEEIFTSPKASEIKHALTEVYTAEAVFLTKLEELRKEKSLTKTDREKLEELISNTKTLLGSLTSFDQLGVKQESKLRTLRQDFATKVALGSQKTGADQKIFNDIAILQETAKELSGAARTAKGHEKERLMAELSENNRKIDEAFEKLAKSRNKESKQIAAMYKEIDSLTLAKGSLPKIPVGLFDNLTATFSKQAVHKQYELLKHFKTKLRDLKLADNQNFTKYQELGNKITRYPMVIDAILQKIPEEMQPKALQDLSFELTRQVIRVNAGA